MASAYKPTYLRPIPEGAERCKLQGAPAVRYTDRRGKKHVRVIHLDAEGKPTGQMVCEQGRWWLKWTAPDGTVRRAKGFSDRTATEQEAGRREREAQLAQAGVLTVDEAHLSAPLADHFRAYIDTLARKGKKPTYYELTHTRLARIADACGWLTLRQVSAVGMEAHLATMADGGAAVKTINDYLDAAKGFCHWCVRTRRLAGNPLASVDRADSDRDGNDKAALTPAQAEALLRAATRHKLLYLVAIRTGLRRGELRDLQWGDIRLDAQRPHVKLRASATKAKRADTLPLRADVADALREARPADPKPSDRVFLSTPRMWTFRADLDRAGIPHADATGRKVCFHSLRVTFGTWLAQAGTAPRVHMELMRHTDMKLTMGFYTDPRLLDTLGAVNDLPDLAQPDVQQAARALRTGTDDLPVQTPFSSIASKYVSECPSLSISGQNGEAEMRKTPIKQGFSDGGGGNRTRVP